MKGERFNKRFFAILFILPLLRIGHIPRNAAAQESNRPEVICLPDAYLLEPDTCIPLGPSEYLTDHVKDGGFYELQPFPGKKLDPALSVIPYKYAKINAGNKDRVHLYYTPADAAAEINPADTINPGPNRYISYTDEAVIANKSYVRSKKLSLWLRASPTVVPHTTLARTFSKTPEYEFGWIFESCHPWRKPDYNSGKSDAFYNREDVVNLYETVEKDGTIWFRIGENEWVDRNHFRAARFNTTPPEEIDADRWIELDLDERVLMAYDQNELVYAAMVATGMQPSVTEAGIFQVSKKKETDTMSGAFEKDRSDYFLFEDVPFAVYFNGQQAFHGTYWRTWFGLDQSHGCVNMTIGDAHWLYDWVEIGDWVYIHASSESVPAIE